MILKFLLPVLFSTLNLTSFVLTAQEMPATLILVRHAEKAAEPGNDPALTEKGRQRAVQLKALLSQEEIDAIYSTPFRRTTETVSPLSEETGVEITSYDPRQSPGDFLDQLLSDHAGEVVVICGHSNTIPMMLNHLTSSQEYEQLEESDYDDVFVVSVVGGVSRNVVHLTYSNAPVE